MQQRHIDEGKIFLSTDTQVYLKHKVGHTYL